ncbi:shikimate dehydrogenase [bacterium]|nr:shikimate dehydrogenase [bacterium]
MFEIDAKTYCVIGHPIGHTLSPVIHKMVYESMTLDLNYTAVHVLPEKLAGFIDTVRKTGCPGFNATIPHKQTVMPHLDTVDPSARRIGAVNTVKNENGRLTGYNTDATGLKEALKRGGWTPGGPVVLLGAGGAARAAIEAMGLMKVRELFLYDIVPERVEGLISGFSGQHDMRLTGSSLETGLLDRLPDADLLINATPVGMWPETDRSPVPDPERLPAGVTVFDMVYKPLETRLMREASQRGARTISGLSMLILQALAADEIWLGRSLPGGLYERIRETIIK